MRKLLDKLVDRMVLWGFGLAEVGCFDGIRLVDARWRDGSRLSFRITIEESLRLVASRDPRRYTRIRQYIKWVVNRVSNTMGAEYDFRRRMCSIEYDDMTGVDRDVVSAFYACILVHEATHGAIESRGIRMSPDNRVAVERLCTTEQNRFATRLASVEPQRYPARLLHFEFREDYWRGEWMAAPQQRRKAFISRFIADMRAERGASPNGGPATPVGNSEVTEGPPSVS